MSKGIKCIVIEYVIIMTGLGHFGRREKKTVWILLNFFSSSSFRFAQTER